jgi:alpha/beta superfamily hydrolase
MPYPNADPDDAEIDLGLLEVREFEEPHGIRRVLLDTNRGSIECRYHEAGSGDIAVLWVFGSGGGLGGPAGGIYERLGSRLRGEGVASLQVAFRTPGDLLECALDVLMAMAWLEANERSRIILVGHAFGGGVVIATAAVSEAVVAVAALSSQRSGTESVALVSPRPLLLLHGLADEVVPAESSRHIFAQAGEPKQLIVYPECAHGLDACREQLDEDLLTWLRDVAHGGLAVQ